MKLKRELTPREIDFFGKLQDLFLQYNAIIKCEENKEMCIIVDVQGDALWQKDISFHEFFDDTDVDELFEESCKLHNKKVI